jgi:hypothetical protein
MSALADSGRTIGSACVRVVPILLRKSVVTSHGGWRDFLDLATYHPSLAEFCAPHVKHASVTGGGRATNFASLRRF